MSMELCMCDTGLGNTGLPNGVKPFGKLSYIIAMRTYADDGTLNTIDLSTTFDQAYLDGKINEDDASKRWYPIKDLKFVDRPKSESVFADLGDGTQEFVREGVRSFSAQIPQGTATFLGKLIGARCQEISFFEVDVCNNLAGNIRKVDSDNVLVPFKLGNNTLDVILNLATDERKQYIMLNFQYDINERDQLRGFITDASITASLTPNDVNGLIDVKAELGTITATTIPVTLTFDYGDVKSPLPYQVAEQSDFYLYNTTADAQVLLSGFTVTDSSLGQYVLEFAAQTTSDVGYLEIRPSDKNGYEMARVSVTFA